MTRVLGVTRLVPLATATVLATTVLASSGSVASAAPRRTHEFPIQGCPVTYAHSHHDYPATDILAARGCRVVAPTAGRIDELSTRDTWNPATNRGADRGGLSFSLIGTDGVRYYGSHLSALTPGLHVGEQVRMGQALGKVGNTGDARGLATHVHFGISWPTKRGVWWVRRGEVYPWPYLDSWRAGGDKSPAAAVTALRRKDGTLPTCSADC